MLWHMLDNSAGGFLPLSGCFTMCTRLSDLKTLIGRVIYLALLKRWWSVTSYLMKFSFHLVLPDKQKQGHKRERVCARVLWADGSHAVLWKSPLSMLFNGPYKTDSLLKYLTQEKRERQRREEERTTVKINKTALCDWCVKTTPDILVTINKCGRGHKGPNFKKGGRKEGKRERENTERCLQL